MANSPENYEHVTDATSYDNSGNSEEKEIFKLKFGMFILQLEKNYKKIFMRNIIDQMKWPQFTRFKKN